MEPDDQTQDTGAPIQELPLEVSVIGANSQTKETGVPVIEWPFELFDPPCG